MKIDTGTEVQFQINAFGDLGLKALRLDGYGVLAWIEERKGIVTRARREVRALDAGLHLEERDIGARDHSAAGIGHGPHNSGGSRLGAQGQNAGQHSYCEQYVSRVCTPIRRSRQKSEQT